MTKRAFHAFSGLVALAVLSWPAGAFGVETPEFALEPAGKAGGGLEIRLDPDGRGRGQVEVRNKLDSEIVLEVSVVPAQVSADGRPSLGGDPAPVAWVKAPTEVRLEAQQRRKIDVTVRRPRPAGDDTDDGSDDAGDADSAPALATAALSVQLKVTGEAPAVIQQSALVIYMRPSSKPATIVGLPPMVAAIGGLALVISGGWTWIAVSRQRRRVKQAREQRALERARRANPPAG